MATERPTSGDIGVDKLLARLRRAAEQDGVDDVDAVVAEFAMFVRAEAPRIATQRIGGHGAVSWGGAMLTAGALSVAAISAMAAGLVPNPLTQDTAVSAADEPPSSGEPADDPATTTPDLPADGRPTTGGGPVTGADGASMPVTDPDALGVVVEQQLELPSPVSPTTSSPTPAATPGAETPPANAPGPTSTTSTTTTTVDPTQDPSGTTPVAGPDPVTDPATIVDPIIDPAIDPADPVASIAAPRIDSDIAPTATAPTTAPAPPADPGVSG